MRIETVTIPEHTVTTTYYEYNDLSDDAKETVKEWYLENCRWPEDFTFDVKCDLLVLFGKNDLDVEYSLNYCQGDGLNVYGKISAQAIFDSIDNDNITYFDKYKNTFTDEEKRTILDYAEYCGMIELPQNCRYGYCMANYIEITQSWTYDLECAGIESIDSDLLSRFEKMVIDMFTDLCKTYEEWGYDYFYEISDEEMCENCEANEWEFDEDENLL